MYGFYVNKNPIGKFAESRKRIAEALGWLRMHNPLYREFLANRETLFLQTKSSLPADPDLKDGRGNPISDHLKEEDDGLAISFQPETKTPQLTSKDDEVGVQHRKSDNIKWDKRYTLGK